MSRRNTSWSEELTRWLIQHSARNAPPSLSERLEEEWLADLAERRGALTRLRFGLGCCWATRVIAHEYAAPKVLATISATGNRVMNAYAQQDFSLFSRRTLSFVLIVGVHGLFILALANGLTHRFAKMIPTGLEFKWMPPAQDAPPPPSLPSPPKLVTHEIKFVQPEVVVQYPPEDESTVAAVTTAPPIVDPIPSSTSSHTVSRVLGGPGKAFPNTEDYYPFDARRRGETGAATVQTCVDDRGRLTAAPALVQTSGSASLDEGALKLAKAGSGHYRATTEDGRPVSSCYEFRIRFDFKK